MLLCFKHFCLIIWHYVGESLKITLYVTDSKAKICYGTLRLYMYMDKLYMSMIFYMSCAKYCHRPLMFILPVYQKMCPSMHHKNK